VVTFVTTASGITAVGLNAPVWGLLAGLVVLVVQRVGRRPADGA
jgi:benzoate membrane transport protein